MISRKLYTLVSLLGGMNFNTLVIQWPIFFGLYHSIENAHGISTASFFGIVLGHKSILLAVLTAVAYGLQSWLSLIGVPEEQKKQTASMMFITPIMMFFMTYITNAGIALYFFIGAIMVIIQTLIIVAWRPKLRRHVENTFVVKDVAEAALAGTLKSAPSSNKFMRAMQEAQEKAAKNNDQNSRKDINVEETDTTLNSLENRERNKLNNK